MIYFASFLHSHITYGINVYGNTTANRFSKLKVLNNKSLRLKKHKPMKTYINELCRTYNTLSLHLLHNY